MPFVSPRGTCVTASRQRRWPGRRLAVNGGNAKHLCALRGVGLRKNKLAERVRDFTVSEADSVHARGRRFHTQAPSADPSIRGIKLRFRWIHGYNDPRSRARGKYHASALINPVRMTIWIAGHPIAAIQQRYRPPRPQRCILSRGRSDSQQAENYHSEIAHEEILSLCHKYDISLTSNR